jgi:hypothetical protein
MWNVVDFGSLEHKLQELQEQSQKLDFDLQKLSPQAYGVADIMSYRLRKEKGELKMKISEINRILHPDIIA